MKAPVAVVLTLVAVLPWAGAYTPSVTRETDIAAIDSQAATRREAQTRAWVMSEWQISRQEYDRYRNLMTGIRGYFSEPNLPPLMALGIHARSPEERRRYADRLVRILYQDGERVLAFEREVQAAWRRLGQPMLDPVKLEKVLQARQQRKRRYLTGYQGRRLALFVAADDRRCPACLTRVRQLLGDPGWSGLDIYVVDTHDDDAIRQWARRAGITPGKVQRRRITLNHGADVYALHLGSKAPLPALFQRQGGQLAPLAGGSG